ncbi:hypothetical protein CBS147353_8956 [Aspergillus niger]|nr:hypothetical protein CBS147353_8956 [Aspergillus niger]
MAVPQSCTVLVIGGGPAGSYAAAALAREGFETVLLEADKFPRYHIGESTLPSLRHFFKFIDFYDTFDAHGFYHKNGAVFRLAQAQPDAYTDFLEAGGPDAYAWNLIRSESDDLLFRHAGTCGAHIFDETKVDTIQFESHIGELSLSRIELTDNLYGLGTHMEGSPYFEALDDASGWAWFMPLHDGTRSVGVVQDQKIATEQKRQLGRPSSLDFYKQCVEKAPRTRKLLSGAEIVTNVRAASDWSYTASTYHIPNARICGDAGSFIDPLFSSGVHLAVTGGLSAAATIAASIRGDCDEQTAGSWHTKKTVESYTRFFLAVSSATKQIREQYEPIIQDMEEEGFQRAFDLLRPIIQGTVDADNTGKISYTEISKALEFCFRAFTYVPPEKKDALFEKLKNLGVESGKSDAKEAKALDDIEKHLTRDELQVLEILRSRRMIREDPFEMDSFTLDTIDGLAPNLVRGKLGLVKANQAKIDKAHFFSPRFLDGKAPGIRDESIFLPTSRVRLG